VSRRQERPDWDDGRTVADMEGVERPSLFVPRSPGAGSGGSPGPAQAPGGPNPGGRRSAAAGNPFAAPANAAYTPRERRWAILGALRAALLIAGVFILGLGILIGILVLVWR